MNKNVKLTTKENHNCKSYSSVIWIRKVLVYPYRLNIYDALFLGHYLPNLILIKMGYLYFDKLHLYSKKSSVSFMQLPFVIQTPPSRVKDRDSRKEGTRIVFEFREKMSNIQHLNITF